MKKFFFTGKSISEVSLIIRFNCLLGLERIKRKNNGMIGITLPERLKEHTINPITAIFSQRYLTINYNT